MLVPSYNSMPFVTAALDSIACQLSDKDEIIIQDAGSTDGSVAAYEAMAKLDSRVSLTVEADSGQSDALNRALSRASGTHILWLNADDIVLPDSLAAFREAADRSDGHQPKLLIGGHQVLRADGSLIASYASASLSHQRLMLHGCYVFSGSILINRELLIRLGGFSSDFSYCMDLDLLFRLTELSPDQISIVPNLIGALRRHDASKSGTSGHLFVLEGWRVRSKYITTSRDHGRRICAAVWQYLASISKPIRFSPLYQKLRGRQIS
ncbi:glycosyltransferase [Cryobacterium melibiosiphilum]|uniref:glycosyltransferase n=1 Tax=Cryobacterium melibiosiphilum TaxID=995039 RepID=UPI00227959DF|nr:glycosyltransferase [Cryobacterium melibiosiphilum]